jgi:Right handed beta helix region/Putative metal-binding motif
MDRLILNQQLLDDDWIWPREDPGTGVFSDPAPPWHSAGRLILSAAHVAVSFLDKQSAARTSSRQFAPKSNELRMFHAPDLSQPHRHPGRITRPREDRIMNRGALRSALCAAAMAIMCGGVVHATTYWADADPSHTNRCTACTYPDLNTDPDCGTYEKPFRCIGDGVKKSVPGDMVVALEGTYQECFTISTSGSSSLPIVIMAQNSTQDSQTATISAHPSYPGCGGGTSQVIYWTASHVTLSGFKITSAVSPFPNGIHMTGGSNNRIENSDIFGNERNVQIFPLPTAVDDVISGCDIHDATKYEAILLAGTTNAVIENSHIFHNPAMGILEGPYSDGTEAIGTKILDSEIDNNGRTRHNHGLYMKGLQGLVQNNRIHHNSGWGIHLWAAPQGTAAAPFIVERNDVYGNGRLIPYGDGGGIVVGGTVSESPIPGTPARGLPKYVEVRYNTIHHNLGSGLSYGIDSCTSYDDFNTFHHNTIYKNLRAQLLLSYAASSKIRIRDNVIVSVNAVDNLVSAFNTNLAANGLNGDFLFLQGASADNSTISWNGSWYSFNQVKNTGVIQNTNCDEGGGSPSIMLSNGSYQSPTFVDSGTSLWLDQANGSHLGNYHLQRGSAGIHGGICCAESSGGQDIDLEAISCSPPQGQCLVQDSGVGADYFKDSDADGTADVFDCHPSMSDLCDGDTWSESSETAVCASSAAPYDPVVYPGATELCDGKVNDCYGSGLSQGEVDADGDGFYAGCSADCDDNDARTFPGSAQVCDGKNNDCTSATWPTVPADEIEVCDGIDNNCDSQVDEALGCSNAIDQWGPSPGHLDSGSVASLGYLPDSNTYEVLSETGNGNSPKKLTTIWTFSGLQTGVAYDLSVEGFVLPGGVQGADSFNFSVVAVSGNCSTNSQFGSTILTVNKSSDDNVAQVTSIGTLGNSVLCVRVVDSKGLNDTQSDILKLDRVFLSKH